MGSGGREDFGFFSFFFSPRLLCSLYLEGYFDLFICLVQLRLLRTHRQFFIFFIIVSSSRLYFIVILRLPLNICLSLSVSSPSFFPLLLFSFFFNDCFLSHSPASPILPPALPHPFLRYYPSVFLIFCFHPSITSSFRLLSVSPSVYPSRPPSLSSHFPLLSLFLHPFLHLSPFSFFLLPSFYPSLQIPLSSPLAPLANPLRTQGRYLTGVLPVAGRSSRCTVPGLVTLSRYSLALSLALSLSCSLSHSISRSLSLVLAVALSLALLLSSSLSHSLTRSLARSLSLTHSPSSVVFHESLHWCVVALVSSLQCMVMPGGGEGEVGGGVKLVLGEVSDENGVREGWW